MGGDGAGCASAGATGHGVSVSFDLLQHGPIHPAAAQKKRKGEPFRFPLPGRPPISQGWDWPRGQILFISAATLLYQLYQLGGQYFLAAETVRV